ncbi:hypothetical protein LCGC14_2015240 [marine sediment metagenome]|uniref:Tail assembly chaperone n=1 Tax=marine sediment metagenome TaxID=412755 RepID=A0A0F9EZB3_9ZZZZ
MSQFTPTVKFTTEFDGDTITMTLKRLTRKQLHTCAPIMENLDNFEKKLQYLDVMAQLLPDVVSDFRGLMTENGEASLESILEEGFFGPLIDEISGELFRISFHQEEDVKKSERSAAERSKE